MLDANDLQRSDHDRQVFNSLPRPHWLDAATGPKALDPDPDYIEPSLFSHTLNVNQPVHKIFQSKDLADRTMGHYWVRNIEIILPNSFPSSSRMIYFGRKTVGLLLRYVL